MDSDGDCFILFLGREPNQTNQLYPTFSEISFRLATVPPRFCEIANPRLKKRLKAAGKLIP